MKASEPLAVTASAIACNSSFVSARPVGFDGLFVIKPDGRLYIQSGIGNLGTESVSDCHRVTAEVLGVPWEKCEVTWGHTGKNLPWSCPSGGSQTTHAHTRAAYVAALDAKDKLCQIAAKEFEVGAAGTAAAYVSLEDRRWFIETVAGLVEEAERGRAAAY